MKKNATSREPPRGIFALLTACLLVSGSIEMLSAEQPAKFNFPVVVASAEAFLPFGLAIVSGSASDLRLGHLCYAYHELISVSHERLERYRKSGFTLNSLCLGLMSETLFNPETGERLPTYIFADHAYLEERRKAHPEIKNYTVPYISSEHPLELPSCFRRALPFSDCVFNFDRLTGRALSPTEREAFRKLGEEMSLAIQEAIERRIVCGWPFCSERSPSNPSHVPGSLEAEFGCDFSEFQRLMAQARIEGIKFPSKAQLGDAGISCIDISLNLPAGFGYTTDTGGELGGFVSPELLKLVADPQRRTSQIDVNALALEIAAKVRSTSDKSSRGH